MKFTGDTIAAIATPAGEGGLAVLRISGTEAIPLVSARFSGRTKLSAAATHTAHLGVLSDADGTVVDQVVATVFRSPHSYTGEDTVEISCHGGLLVSRRILELLLRSGARLAEPGEFTKRAFLNGRMDLAQAEAVADLIHARSDAARRSSMSQLRGFLSDTINELRSSLVDAVGLLELELDFAEDGYELIDRTKVAALLDGASRSVRDLTESYAVGRFVRDGVRVALVGPTNAGKSSLLNALLRESRAIVTDIPGTTRDVIVENLLIDGILFRVADTAGLRTTSDFIEQEGVRRSTREAEDADIVLVVLDTARDRQSQLEEIGSVVAVNEGKKFVIALNKVDLSGEKMEEWGDLDGPLGSSPMVPISALTGHGMRELEATLSGVIHSDRTHETPSTATITNARHYSILLRVTTSLELAIQSLKGRKSGEFIALDLRNSLDELGAITGQVTTDDILNSVFSRFCIGK